MADSDLDALKDVMIEEAQRKAAYPICSMKYGYALAASIALEDVASGFGPIALEDASVRCPHSGSPNLYDRPRVMASVQILSPEYQARESR